jgi:hypothetical protein
MEQLQRLPANDRICQTKQNTVIAANPPRRYVTPCKRRGMKVIGQFIKDAKKFLPTSL